MTLQTAKTAGYLDGYLGHPCSLSAGKYPPEWIAAYESEWERGKAANYRLNELHVPVNTYRKESEDDATAGNSTNL